MIKTMIKPIASLVLFLMLSLNVIGQQKGTFSVTTLGKNYTQNAEKLIPGLYHHLEKAEVTGGNTSLRNTSKRYLVWKGDPKENGYGYFQRNRDLGQVFTVPTDTDVVVDALTLRTSRGNNAIMQGTPGAELSIVFFEVTTATDGTFRINENETSKGDLAKHGFDHQLNRADDYIEGASYRFIKEYHGGIFPPNAPITTQYVYDRGKGEPFGEQAGHLLFFRCDFAPDTEITLKAGKQYAFLVGFKKPGKDQGLALAISTDVHAKEPASFVRDTQGNIRWGVRREGNGTLPPSYASLPKPPKGKLLKKLVRESTFPKNHYSQLSPTTDGYPDVDTYRTLQFYLEVR